MLTPVDYFYFALTFTVGILGVCTALLTYQLVKLLKSSRRIVDEVESTTRDINLVKESVKMGLLNITNKVLSKFSEGGETKKHGTKTK